jgi:uncharacterized delta-60 repeat protein
VGETRNATSYGDLFITRYSPDGNLDISFASQGFDTLDFGHCWERPNAVAIQPDGKIIVGGRSDDFMGNVYFFMARYKTDGSLDANFGANGRIFSKINDNQTILFSFALNNDGKIICGGCIDSDFLVFRLLSNGMIDSTFGTNGYVTTDFGLEDVLTSIAIQQDGKIVAAGSTGTTPTKYDFALARYTENGIPDSTFSYDGRLSTTVGPGHDECNDVIVAPDGKIFAAGATNNNPAGSWALVKYNSNGSLDLGFNQSGKVVTAMNSTGACNSAKLQGDGKIIMGGFAANLSNTDFALLRLNSDGTADSLFGTNGKVFTDLGSNSDYSNEMKIQPDGRILLVGKSFINLYEDIAVTRYISGYSLGIIDFSTDANAVFVYPNPINTEAVLEYELLKNEILSVELFDMSGKLIKTFISGESRSKGKHKETLSFEETWPSGSYLLSINNNSKKIGLKIVKE